MQKYYERITGNKLALPMFIWVDLLNGYILLLKSPEVKQILNNCISKLAELESVRNSIAQGKRKGKKNKLPTLSNIGRNLSKKAMCPKKSGVTDFFKLQHPGEVVVLAKSAIFTYKSSSMHALEECCGAIAT